MGLKRFPDWPARLLAAIEEKNETRFSPGKHDCCISACDIIERMTGTDIAANFRDYSNKKEMLAVLAEHGGVEAIADSVMREYGCEEIIVPLAGRGDMVMLNTVYGPTMVVIDLDGIHACACAVSGWRPVNIKTHATRAWRIG